MRAFPKLILPPNLSDQALVIVPDAVTDVKHTVKNGVVVFFQFDCVSEDVLDEGGEFAVLDDGKVDFSVEGGLHAGQEVPDPFFFVEDHWASLFEVTRLLFDDGFAGEYCDKVIDDFLLLGVLAGFIVGVGVGVEFDLSVEVIKEVDGANFLSDGVFDLLGEGGGFEHDFFVVIEWVFDGLIGDK